MLVCLLVMEQCRHKALRCRLPINGLKAVRCGAESMAGAGQCVRATEDGPAPSLLLLLEVSQIQDASAYGVHTLILIH
jgi:hypothetical protein